MEVSLNQELMELELSLVRPRVLVEGCLMGLDQTKILEADSVTNKFKKMWDSKNIYFVDYVSTIETKKHKGFSSRSAYLFYFCTNKPIMHGMV